MVSYLSAILLVVHLVCGCCWHHSHAWAAICCSEMSAGELTPNALQNDRSECCNGGHSTQHSEAAEHSGAHEPAAEGHVVAATTHGRPACNACNTVSHDAGSPCGGHTPTLCDNAACVALRGEDVQLADILHLDVVDAPSLGLIHGLQHSDGPHFCTPLPTELTSVSAGQPYLLHQVFLL